MSIKRGQINPLGVLGLRKISFIPEHFVKLSVPKNVDIRSIERWIETNLNSRYAIQSNFKVGSDNKLTNIIEIGLEDPKELTLLSLGCQYLHKERTF
ncbi:MAG: hypothetical protein EBU90_04640 [Proteobacteria bacterium]|nr:hypothetical protein [Pseudomonadota bacterium]NBP13729.1 hypothetical protein [bacterium]